MKQLVSNSTGPIAPYCHAVLALVTAAEKYNWGGDEVSNSQLPACLHNVGMHGWLAWVSLAAGEPECTLVARLGLVFRVY